ncbi:hypothetical protein [Nibribacter koreensis]|uniref:MORN repeat variant n=1 Tax=Nibribacter koreensis TaxID=1084519 RepID=A0ABP8FTX4_9BACT
MAFLTALFVKLFLLKSSVLPDQPAQVYLDIQDIKQTFKTLGRDSAEFYYDNKWNLVKPECAEYIRYTKISEDGAFTGPFHDVSKAGALITRGSYENKLKSGPFKEMYENGNVKSAGIYKNNVRDGEWKLYFEDGSPNLVLYYKTGVPMIVAAWNKEGKQMITGGNGTIDQTTGFNGALQGMVKDSLMVGSWVFITSGFAICKEEYAKGVFMEGTFMSGLSSTSKAIGDKYQGSKIDFLQEPPFVAAEKFGFRKSCPYFISTAK